MSTILTFASLKYISGICSNSDSLLPRTVIFAFLGTELNLFEWDDIGYGALIAPKVIQSKLYVWHFEQDFLQEINFGMMCSKYWIYANQASQKHMYYKFPNTVTSLKRPLKSKEKYNYSKIFEVLFWGSVSIPHCISIIINEW